MRTEVEIPERLQRRPRDPARGFPVPFVTGTNSDGSPNFRAIDELKTLQAIRGLLCGLCGQPLDYWKAFIGGPVAARNRTYTDPAMHLECAEYARLVCPFLVHRRGSHATPAPGTIDPVGFMAGKPEKVVVYVTRGFRLVPIGRGGWVIRADKPVRLEEHEYAS